MISDNRQTNNHLSLSAKIKISIAILLAASLLILLLRNSIFGKVVEAYPVISGELHQTIVVSGRVIWPQRVAIASTLTARVKNIAVKEGQNVTKGQLLIELEDNDARANVAQNKAAVAQATAKLQQTQEFTLPNALENQKRAQADFEQSQKHYNRLVQIKNQELISEEEIDSAKRNLDIALSQLTSAQLQVQSQQSTGSETIVAKSNLAQAQANMLFAQSKLDQYTLLAPADGILIGRFIEIGDIAQNSKELMTLAVSGETQIQVNIDEKNLAKIALGQHALISADAFPEQSFPAVLSYINPSVDVTRGSVEVKLTVTNPPTYLKQDMTVSVDIETAKKMHALIIPSIALHSAQSNAPWVFVVRNNKIVRQIVKIGLRGDERIEILSGLTINETVIPTTNGLIAEGMKARVKLLNLDE